MPDQTVYRQVRRGWHEEDQELFDARHQQILTRAVQEVCYLLDRGYHLRNAVTFVANHHLLTDRQRNALLRISASQKSLALRKQKQLDRLPAGCTVQVDALNAVVLMETALSGSLLIRCLDGCIRDLSGLSGTYAIIAATDPAIDAVLQGLQKARAGRAVFWIDAPVSNSGRLRSHLLARGEALQFPLETRMVHNADVALRNQENVISGDSIVLENCRTWYNLYPQLVEACPAAWLIEIRP